MALRHALAALTLAATSGLSACGGKTGETGLIVSVSSDGPIDCLMLGARQPGGENLRVEAAIDALGNWRQDTHRILVYSGGPLGLGAVELIGTGHRGDCSSAPVAEGTLETSFRQGDLLQVSLAMKLLGPDSDSDGFADADDCAPKDPLIFPQSGAETVCDGFDSDCDGSVDDGCACESARPCYPLGLSHPSAGAGACSLGEQRCVNGFYALCTGAVLPAVERCDGIDTDCDGLIDPADCPCLENSVRQCYTAGPARSAGTGQCRPGTQICRGGVFGPCSGDVGPTSELCNGLDDDCDGEVDEASDVRLPLCRKLEGVCAGARRSCADALSDCTSADYERHAALRGSFYVETETDEHCDGADNDCDGLIDEGCPCLPGTTETCHPMGAHRPESAVGVCERGTRVCLDTALWGPCLGYSPLSGELCNGLDDDCDGEVDEGVDGVGEACSLPLPGVCSVGVRRCVGGDFICAARFAPQPELCNGLDDDCDGVNDEGFDLQNDPNNCGSCGQSCPAASSCRSGRCLPLP